MQALVTGGAGFIGSHVVDLLLERGDGVTVLDDLSSGRRENVAEGAELIVGSITDPAAVAEVFEHRPDAVFHLAAQIDVRVSVADPAFDLVTNVGGTINLLEQVRRHDGCRLVFASTGGAIYGEGKGRELPVREGAELRPDAPYGLSKLCAEQYISLYERLYGVDAVSLRLGNVYGPRQDPHGEAGVVAIFYTALLDGGKPKVFGDGEQTRDYVFVGDVARAFVAASTSGTGVYNIGTGIETSVLELGRQIAATCGVSFEPEFASRRTGEVQRIAIASALAERELGWRAEHDLERGLAATAEWARATR